MPKATSTWWHLCHARTGSATPCSNN